MEYFFHYYIGIVSLILICISFYSLLKDGIRLWHFVTTFLHSMVKQTMWMLLLYMGLCFVYLLIKSGKEGVSTGSVMAYVKDQWLLMLVLYLSLAVKYWREMMVSLRLEQKAGKDKTE